MKKLFGVILCIALLLVSSVAFAASVPQPVLDARDSVFNIVTLVEDGFASGSGFAIGTDRNVEYVVTNHHVIEGNSGLILVSYGMNESVEASIVIDLPEKDLCVLRLDSPIEAEPFTLYDGDPYGLTGKQVYAIGFPGAADALFDRNQSSSESATVTDGIVSAVKNVNSDMTGVSAVALQVNVGINHGNSGGPLMSSNSHRSASDQ